MGFKNGSCHGGLQNVIRDVVQAGIPVIVQPMAADQQRRFGFELDGPRLELQISRFLLVLLIFLLCQRMDFLNQFVICPWLVVDGNLDGTVVG